MALTIKHLNEDASFMLSFEPELPPHIRGTAAAPKPYIILLDPWITGPSKIFHSKISVSTHKHPACVASLSELPEPDLVIISQHKSDHCNEATLRQLPGTGTKTRILAEPASARVIKSWKHFDGDKIWTVPKWEDPRTTGKSTVLRVPVPAVTPDGQPGEVTVAWIPQKRDLACLHSAIALTYRPPSTDGLAPPPAQYTPLAPPSLISPPATPRSVRSTAPPFPKVQQKTIPIGSRPAPLTPPMSPTSSVCFTRPTAAAAALPVSPTTELIPPPPPPPAAAAAATTTPAFFSACRPISSSAGTITAAAQHREHGNNNNGTTTTTTTTTTTARRPLSLIFSPHGINYAHLAPYASSHLVSEAALPLTALLHCMDSISNPWWLGGNICAGLPAGAEIARRLCARVWLSAHDGDKNVRGLATGLLKTRRYGRDEVLEEVCLPPGGDLSSSNRQHARTASSSYGGDDTTTAATPCGCEVVEDSGPPPGGDLKRPKNVSSSVSNPTDVFRLSSGEEVVVSGDGLVQLGSVGRSHHRSSTTTNATTIVAPPSAAASTVVVELVEEEEEEDVVDLNPVFQPEKHKEKERSGGGGTYNNNNNNNQPTERGEEDENRTVGKDSMTTTWKDDHGLEITSYTTPPQLITTMAQESWGPQKLCDTLVSLPKITVEEM